MEEMVMLTLKTFLERLFKLPFYGSRVGSDDTAIIRHLAYKVMVQLNLACIEPSWVHPDALVGTTTANLALALELGRVRNGYQTFVAGRTLNGELVGLWVDHRNVMDIVPSQYTHYVVLELCPYWHIGTGECVGYLHAWVVV